MKDDMLDWETDDIADDDINGENKKTPVSSKIGNTLDYYNEELSRKAVSKIFDDRDFKNESSGAKVSEYPEDEKGGFVRGFDDPGKPVTVHQRVVRDEFDDVETDYELYRKKPRYNGNMPEPNPAIKVKPKQSSFANKAPNRPSTPRKVSSPEKSGGRYEDRDFEETRARYKDREYIPRPKTTSAPRPKKPKNSYGSNYDSDMGDRMPAIKVIIAVICFVILTVFVVLILNVNGANEKLRQAEEKLLTYADSDTELQTIRIEKEGLEESVKSLDRNSVV